MAWIQPLSLETWITQVFAGTPDIFLAIAALAIFSLAGYFRMTVMAMFFMFAVFLLMFSGFISSPIIILVAVIGGLLIGFQLSRLFS
jgi:hypothetical protein